MTPLLEARGVALAGRLEPTDLLCSDGETVAVIGPNGAGKTSLLRALAGIELRHGSVSIAGEGVTKAPPARRMRLLSFLPATRSLVWPISARDVISLGLPRPDPTRVEELIELLELESFADRPVNSLSTGERSRVLFARALAARPRVLLLDEPLSNLDPYWVLRTLRIMQDAASIELICAEGPDWVGIDGQHGQPEYSDLLGLIDAANVFGVPAIVRVPGHDVGSAGRVIDAGAQGIIFPTVEGGAAASTLVSACRFPPRGGRSYGPVRRSPRYAKPTPGVPADRPV